MFPPLVHVIPPTGTATELANEVYATLCRLGHSKDAARREADNVKAEIETERKHHHREAPIDADDFINANDHVPFGEEF